MLFLDLDRFKVVNDSLGHAAGDELLDRGRRPPAAALRPDDMVARLGGDEFTVLVEDIADHDEAEALAERLASARSRRPFELDGGELYVVVEHRHRRRRRPGATPRT